MNTVEAIRVAREQIAALTGLSIDTVSRFARDAEGWSIDMELIEMKRIPNSSDVLATYQLRLDPEGNLISYLRTQRYYRSQVKG
jgi:hypothetical protein